MSWLKNAEDLKSILQSLAACNDQGKEMDLDVALLNAKRYFMDGLYWHLDRVAAWQAGEVIVPIYIA